jgi:amino acid transporter
MHQASSSAQSNGSAPKSCWLWHVSGTYSHVSHKSCIRQPTRSIYLSCEAARYFKWIFTLSSGIVILDFVLNLIWLPIATSKTLGFRTTHEAFMTTYNGTGAPPGWNWALSYLATAGILIGFDASGHVAEETKNAPIAAARGIFWSTVVSGLGGFSVVILFLFCVVSLSTFLHEGLVELTVISRMPRPSSHTVVLNLLSQYTPRSSATAVILS